MATITTKKIESVLELNNLNRDVEIESLELCNRVSMDTPPCVTYITSKDYFPYLENKQIKAVFLTAEVFQFLNKDISANLVTIIVKEPEKSFYKLHNYLATETDFYEKNIEHVIDENVSIHPTAVIEDNVSIGSGSVIGANVVIHKNTIIGKNVHIHSNVILGTEGFQVLKSSNGPYLAKHIGGLIIGNEVSIGSSSVIAKSLFNGNTVIGNNTLIDCKVFIAHNCVIGENCVLVAGVTLLGSTTIEDEAWISVSSVTLNKVNIGKKAFVGASSLVSKNVKNDHKVFGIPARVIGKNSE